MERAFQDFYPERDSHCFGCGRSNPRGLHLKSYWDGENTIARFTPPPEFSGGVPGNVYGGLIASLMDCHGAASAAAAAHRHAHGEAGHAASYPDRKSVVVGKSVDLGGFRIIKNKKIEMMNTNS